LGLELISQVFLMSIFVAEIEETFRAGVLRPTFVEWLSDYRVRLMFLLSMAIVIYAIIPTLRIVGLGLFIFAAIDVISLMLSKNKNQLFSQTIFKSEVARQVLAIVLAAAIFGILHLKVFATDISNEGLMINAFLFATIAGFINWQFKSTVASKVAHCMNNAIVMCAAIGLPLSIGFLITGVYAFLLGAMAFLGGAK